MENGAIIGDRGGRGGGAVVCERKVGAWCYAQSSGTVGQLFLDDEGQR